MPTQRIAVVGSGPCGFYAAGALLDHDPVVEVDLFERLSTPYGLIRGGVAPDHPKIKNVARVFAKIAESERLRFFGNVEVGRHVAVDDLLARYDKVLFATGSPAARALGIPGDDLPGSRAAGDFVAWYNGHPDADDLDFDLSGVETVVVVGVGNVALDVARMLVKAPDELATTDMPARPLAALRRSSVRRVVLLGRRGLAQAAFSTTSLKELGDLDGVTLGIRPRDIELDAASAEWLETQDRTTQRTFERNRDYLGSLTQFPDGRRVDLWLCASPVEVVGADRVTGVRVERNALVLRDGAIRPAGTGSTELVEAELILAAVGYRGLAIPGLPFDARRGVVANDDHRVLGPDGPVPGLYVAGWAQRGPQGLVGDAKKFAHAAVTVMQSDAPRGHAHAAETLGWLRDRQPEVVTWADWLGRDAMEIAAGEAVGKPRRKDLA